jgi:hypothetical protein
MLTCRLCNYSVGLHGSVEDLDHWGRLRRFCLWILTRTE